LQSKLDKFEENEENDKFVEIKLTNNSKFNTITITNPCKTEKMDGQLKMSYSKESKVMTVEVKIKV